MLCACNTSVVGENIQICGITISDRQICLKSDKVNQEYL